MLEWLILLGVIGFFIFLFTRRGGMGCCGGGHHFGGLSEKKKEGKPEDNVQG